MTFNETFLYLRCYYMVFYLFVYLILREECFGMVIMEKQVGTQFAVIQNGLLCIIWSCNFYIYYITLQWMHFYCFRTELVWKISFHKKNKPMSKSILFVQLCNFFTCHSRLTSEYCTIMRCSQTIWKKK